MKILPISVLVLASALSALAQQDSPPPVKVKDGHALGVFYGWSPVNDLWGNSRSGVWTLRNDGLLMWGTPEGPIDEFDGRELTPLEKENGSETYSIDGEKFHFRYRDNSTGEGKITYGKDGGIELIEASALRFSPVHPITFPLAGKFDCTTSFTNGAYAMTTTAWSGYSFYPNGAFVLESGAGTTCTHVETYESVQREVHDFYGNEAKGRMGRFQVKGTGLTLTYDDGRTEKRFIAQLFDIDRDGLAWILIGRGRFDGKPGKFPGEAESCKAEQFEVRLPKGWKESSQETNGIKVHTLVPGDASAGLAILAIGLDVDAATRVKTEGAEKELRDTVAAFVGKKLDAAGDLEEFQIDGAAAVRVPSTFDKDGVKVRADAIYAVKGGRAIFLIALGTLEGASAFAADLRSILAAARFAADETKDASTGDFSVKAPKTWTATAGKDTGSTTLALAPKGVDSADFFAAIVSQVTEFKSVRDKKAMTWLRKQVTDTIPGVEKQGDVEKLTVDGEPAMGVTYAGSKPDGSVVVLHLYAVIKNGKVALLFMGGKREPVEKHSGAARRAFETLKMREGK
ncbi:MAG: hypothetical protein K8T20_15875 [Planctomycetes bacterium]|nr:hypothetical protein [Planctomycetota bacterium]